MKKVVTTTQVQFWALMYLQNEIREFQSVLDDENESQEIKAKYRKQLKEAKECENCILGGNITYGY